MPHVIVKLYPGKSDDIKNRLADEIAKNVVTITECKENAVSVAFEEIEQGQWAQTVYKQDILGKPETLYIKPGYNPFGTRLEEDNKENILMEHVRAAAELAQISDSTGQFNAMSWLDGELEDNPGSFDRFFDKSWNELSDDQKFKRAMAIRKVL